MSPSPLTPHGVLETSLCVTDLDAAAQFYSSLFGFEIRAKLPGRHVFFYCGQSMLLLFDARVTQQPGPEIGGGVIPTHGTTGAGHIAFRMHENEIDAWKARLAAAGVAIESEIIWPEGGHSLYFRDPSGNSLELATPRLWGFPETTD